VLTSDHIKPFLLHADPDVRSLATGYFSDFWSEDPDLLPLVLDACERHGFEDNLHNLFHAGHFVITEPSLVRLLDCLAGAVDRQTINFLNRVVAHAPGEILRSRREAIERHDKILPEFHTRLRRRQDYLDWSGERLWDELRRFARRSESKRHVDEIDHGYADDLIDALGGHDVPDAGTICRLLERPGPGAGWLETFLVDLAGRRRLKEAVPVLVDKFFIDTDYLLERSSDALARIGDPEAVRLIRREYPDAPFHFRLYTSGVLGKIKHPESEAAMLDLLERETDPSLRMWLCSALCELVSEQSVEIVRREIASGSEETFRELCSPALAVATILGVKPPPGSEKWERERRRQRLAIKQMRQEWADHVERNPAILAEGPLAGLDLGEEPEPPVTAPIRKTGERVGRNDPCLCGSGKKYKKCCGRSS